MRRVLALLILAAPSLVAARPITVGIGLGMSQSKVDGDSGLDANQTLGLFGRLGFTERLSGQLELQRLQTEDNSGVDIRSATGLLVLDFGGGSLVPIGMVGLGYAESSSTYNTTSATHVELGAGLEYRASGGLTIGADLRVGSRQLEDDVAIQYPAYEGDVKPGTTARYVPSYLSAGEYRSARLYVGVRF